MRLTNANLKIINARILKVLNEEFDGELEFDFDGGNYTNTGATMKLKIFAEGAEEEAKREWAIYCGKSGFQPDDFGREFNCRGQIIKITGYKPRRPKYAIQGTNVKNGEIRLYTASLVKAGLFDKPATPEIEDHHGVGLSAMGGEGDF